MALGKKQSVSHEDFLNAWRQIEQIVSREHLDRLVDRTVREIHRICAGRRAAYAWSGGKDSLALQGVCESAGVTDCVFGMTNLEYRAFLRWVTDNMPPGLRVYNNQWDLEWLARHPDMLFPRDATIAGKWFKGVQHWAQERFFRDEQVDVLIVGRRRADGNFVGRGGSKIYTSKGVVRYSPIADWTHEETLAYVHYHRMPMPPFYEWPRGFRVGTHAWPARQWCVNTQHGWSEVWQIDPSIVKDAARLIPSAREFLGE